MPSDLFTVALVTDAFPTDDAIPRLLDRLRAARELGAQLAVLPELPLNPWVPLARHPSHADAEHPGGPRHRALADAARATGLPVLGGAIVRDPATGRRHNTALLLGADGDPLLRYRKIHLPDEEGYWEAHHYEPGDRLHAPARLAGWGIGVQICSDVNRPQGCNALAALGAEVVLAPARDARRRRTRGGVSSCARTAVTSCAFVVSVNRPSAGSGGVNRRPLARDRALRRRPARDDRSGRGGHVGASGPGGRPRGVPRLSRRARRRLRERVGDVRGAVGAHHSPAAHRRPLS